MSELRPSTEARIMRCPECGRVASVPEWCKRPVCVHAWEGNVPEVWDADNMGDGGRTIEQSPNPEYRQPGPDTWTPMNEAGAERDRLEAALRAAVEEIESEEKRWLEWWARGGKGSFVWKREAVQSARKVLK